MANREFDVAVLGCGIMGSAIARRAQIKGLRTLAWDRNFERAQRVGEGVLATKNLHDATAHAGVVVTMLADAHAVLEVMDKERGFDTMQPDAAWVQMATIGLAGITRCLEVANTRSNIVFIDAPVSGSKDPAEHGKLLILASTNADKVPDGVTALFEAIGQRTKWLGVAGRGTRMKLVLNTWLSELMEGLAETLEAADSLDISPQDFQDCIEGGPMAPPWVIAKLKKIESGATQDTEFPLKWATKDVHLALEAVKTAAHRSLPALETIATVWDRAVEQGLGDRDVSAAYLALGANGEKAAATKR